MTVLHVGPELRRTDNMSLVMLIDMLKHSLQNYHIQVAFKNLSRNVHCYNLLSIMQLQTYMLLFHLWDKTADIFKKLHTSGL